MKIYNYKKITKSKSRILIAGFVTLFVPLMAQAQISLNFTEGNTNQEVDAYVGKAGDGWISSWESAVSGTTLISSVTDTNPMLGGGNYLHTTNRTGTDTTNAATFAQRRRYTDTGIIKMNESQQISFQFRADDLSGFSSNSSDLIFFFDSKVGRNAPGSGMTWYISYSDDVGVWRFHKAGGTAVDSNMGIVAGTVYSIVVSADPVSGTWDATISNGTTTIQGSDFNEGNPLTFYQSESELGGQLHFGSRLGATRLENAEISYSLDSITVIPEPATVALLAGIFVLAVTFVTRFRRF